MPGSKGGGASTAAAKVMIGRAANLRDSILALMAKGYRLTADEIANQLKASVLAIRPRCSELVRDGKLIKTEARRANISSMGAHVLRHRDAGEEVALPAPTAKPRRPAPPASHPDQVALFAGAA